MSARPIVVVALGLLPCLCVVPTFQPWPLRTMWRIRGLGPGGQNGNSQTPARRARAGVRGRLIQLREYVAHPMWWGIWRSIALQSGSTLLFEMSVLASHTAGSPGGWICAEAPACRISSGAWHRDASLMYSLKRAITSFGEPPSSAATGWHSSVITETGISFRRRKQIQ